jgi:hypothetical protein
VAGALRPWAQAAAERRSRESRRCRISMPAG